VTLYDFIDGLEEYKRRCQPGSFVRALLENDLLMAVSHADSSSAINLAAFVRFTYNNLPGFMWGSPKRVEDWLKGRVDENGHEIPTEPQPTKAEE
jgi:hypothetical protein